MVHHRLISRRGGTRGSSSRPQTRRRSISNSPSSSAENPHYPNTRSGHGRTGLRSAPFPLPAHHTPHTTQFHFRSTLNKPIITATISMSFSEEDEQSFPMTFSMNKMHREGPSHNKDKEEEHEGQASRTRRKGKNVIERSSSDLEPQKDKQVLEMDKPNPQPKACSREAKQQNEGQTAPDDWACLIVEEPATEEFIAKVSNARWHFT